MSLYVRLFFLTISIKDDFSPFDYFLILVIFLSSLSTFLCKAVNDFSITSSFLPSSWFVISTHLPSWVVFFETNSHVLLMFAQALLILCFPRSFVQYKLGDFFSRDLDSFSGLGIDSSPCSSFHDLKSAEAD